MLLIVGVALAVETEEMNPTNALAPAIDVGFATSRQTEARVAVQIRDSTADTDQGSLRSDHDGRVRGSGHQNERRFPNGGAVPAVKKAPMTPASPSIRG